MPTDTPSADPPPGPDPALDTAALETLVGRVADEFTERVRRGESPDPEEYVRRAGATPPTAAHSSRPPRRPPPRRPDPIPPSTRRPWRRWSAASLTSSLSASAAASRRTRKSTSPALARRACVRSLVRWP